MKICRLVWDYPSPDKISYGLGPNFYHISKEQVRQGIEVHVVALKRDSSPEHEEIDGVKVHRVGFPYNLWAMKKLMSLHSQHNFDLVHAHGTCGISYPLFRSSVRKPLVIHCHGTTFGMMRHKFRPPPLVSIRDYWNSKLHEYVSLLRQNFYWRMADRLIAVSNSQRDEINTFYGIDNSKIHVAYNGVDETLFKRLDETDGLRAKLNLDGKRIIIYVGHFGFRKGILYLYQAMQQVLKEVPDAALLCVGGTPKWLGTDVYWRVLQESMVKHGLSGKVKLVGQVPHNKLPSYYSIAEAFAFPTLYEALGKVVIEAMACETPVVASKVGGIPEIITHGRDGLLVEPKDVRRLADYLIQILQDQKFARSMGRRGRQRVEEKFTWAKTVIALKEGYDSLA